jgi:Domain of unknown function (DUF3883)
MPTPSADWTRDQVELVVADYFAMLEAELTREPYSKAEHNRRLQESTGRGKGSIEFKHQNISAVLVNFRQPFIVGYLPRQNYQGLLEQAVLEWLAGHPRFFATLADGPFLDPATRPNVPTAQPLASLVESPPLDRVVAIPEEPDGDRFVRLDFAKRDAENRRLGRFGEEWVLEFEQRRLHDEEARPDLAKKIEWVSDTRGDGAGYDIASFNPDATPRLIEVKTTGMGKQAPFFVSANEVRVSSREREAYQLYRVFEFSTSPRLYQLPGSLEESCSLEATAFRARARSFKQ